ncbi:hypothetical protein B9Z55_011510 [Caenorhabditis nigoni]|uniref:Uncharacterized protein n=1 Tax=Caenorhabditis nigoni TaxID=1611254 RepID=A0A2G5UKI1_9PELO|nr:hypothetical protein B9Z55_011510 [Caenorhabditis nigoni]
MLSVGGGRSAVCRAVIATSIVWLLIDVVILFYYLDPSILTRGQRRIDPEPLAAGPPENPHQKSYESHAQQVFPVDKETADQLRKLMNSKGLKMAENG